MSITDPRFKSALLWSFVVGESRYLILASFIAVSLFCYFRVIVLDLLNFFGIFPLFLRYLKSKRYLTLFQLLKKYIAYNYNAIKNTIDWLYNLLYNLYKKNSINIFRINELNLKYVRSDGIIKKQRRIFIRRELSFRLYIACKRMQNKSHGDLGIHQASAYQHRERNDFKDMGGSNYLKGLIKIRKPSVKGIWKFHRISWQVGIWGTWHSGIL